MERREHEQWYYIPDENGNNDIYTTSGRRISRAVSMQDAEQIITEHNQHAALVEQRDKLAQTIRDLRYRHRRIAEKSGFRDCTCDDCCYLAPHLNAHDAALATIEQADEAQAKGGSGN